MLKAYNNDYHSLSCLKTGRFPKESKMDSGRARIDLGALPKSD
jgi:hypothetical protein